MNLQHGLIAVVLAGLLAAPGSAAEPLDRSCELQLLADVEVEVSPDGIILLPVRVDGVEVSMAMHLAQGVAWVFEDSLPLLPTKPQRRTSSDLPVEANGKLVPNKLVPSHLTIANADFAGWSLFIVPFGRKGLEYDSKNRRVIGILSASFFQAVDVELDLSARRVRLFRHTQCEGGSVYWGGEFTKASLFSDRTGLIVFPMELDGQLIETSFNTAARESRIDAGVTRRFFGFDENSDGIEHEPVPGNSEKTVNSFRAMGLTAKGLTVTNAKVQLGGRRDHCGISADFPATTQSRVRRKRESTAIGYESCLNVTPFTIGTDLLRRLRVYIASKERVVYFTRAASP